MSDECVSRSKEWRVVPWLLIAGVGILYVAGVSQYWNLATDSISYLSLGRSLASGDGYSTNGIPNVSRPPGLPAILAAVEVFRGDDFRLMRLVMALLVIASFFLLFPLIGKLTTRLTALVITLITALSFPAFHYSTRLLSEAPYLFCSLLSLLALDRLVSGRGRWWCGQSSAEWQ